MKNILSGLLLAVAFAAQAQPNLGYTFTYDTLVQLAKTNFRKKAVERILLTGNGRADGDRAVGTTLQKILASDFGKKGRFEDLHREVRHIVLRDYSADTLPSDFGKFRFLSEITLDNCPNLHLQAIQNQLKALPEGNDLRGKFADNIMSLTFQNCALPNDLQLKLEAPWMDDLQEIRFLQVNGLKPLLGDLLDQMPAAFPQLEWLSLNGCGLDTSDAPVLRRLNRLPKVHSISLADNFLTEVPYFSSEIFAIDLSNNLLEQLPDNMHPDSLRNLTFLFLDCNMLNYFELGKLITPQRVIPKSLRSLTFNCNNQTLSEEEAKKLATRFDAAGMAVFMSYSVRYVDDFKPLLPECGGCDKTRDVKKIVMAERLRNRLGVKK